MSQIKDIIYNCRHATFLIEKKQITPLTTKERIRLSIHLTGCAMCKLFQRQSIIINQLVKHILPTTSNTIIKLDESFKIEMQEKIEIKLKG